MNAKAYFRSLSSSVIALSIIIGVSAIFLIERIVPAIDEILQENAYSVSAAVGMFKAISSIQDGELAEDIQANFWNDFERAKENITLKKEKDAIDQIEVNARKFWENPEDDLARKSLSLSISMLADLNLRAMEKKDKEAQFLGLTGAWALGLLLIISVGIQIFLRTKILDSLINPVEQLLSVLEDFNAGRKMRRFARQKATVVDIKKIGEFVNKLLDQITLGGNKKSISTENKTTE